MNTSKLTSRFWAYFLDSIILAGIYSGVLLILIFFFDFQMPINDFMEGEYVSTVALYLTYAILFLIYEVLFLSSKLAATPGKLLLGIELTTDKNNKFIRVLLRSLTKMIALSLYLVHIILSILAAFSKDKRMLYDKITGTFVVNKKTRRSSSGEIDPNELFDEMKRRGLRTYSEQKALAEELYVVTKCFNWFLRMGWSSIFIISFTCEFFHTRTNTAVGNYTVR